MKHLSALQKRNAAAGREAKRREAAERRANPTEFDWDGAILRLHAMFAAMDERDRQRKRSLRDRHRRGSGDVTAPGKDQAE